MDQSHVDGTADRASSFERTEPDLTIRPRFADDLVAQRFWGGVLAVAAVLFVVIAPTWTSDSAGPDAEAAVRDYLTAIRDGDVDRALDLAGIEPDAERDVFLNSRALRDDWEIGEVTEVGYVEDTSTFADIPGLGERVDQAEIAAVIAAADGRTITGRWELVRTHGDSDWIIAEPLVEVTFPETPLWYVEVNGMTVPFEAGLSLEDGWVEAMPSYSLFPGVYRFFESGSEVLDFEPVDLVLAPGAQPDALDVGASVPVPEMTLTRAGEQAAQQAVNDYIDHCAAIRKLVVTGCPFGIDPISGPDTEDYVTDFRDITWEVDEYPVVAAVPTGGQIQLADRRRGTVTLTTQGTEQVSTADGLADGPRRDVTVECEIRTTKLELGVLPDQTMVVMPEGGRYAPQEALGSFDHWTTCG